jgi:hypothetical protein
MPEKTVKGEPELMLEMLSSSQPPYFSADGAQQLRAVEMQVLGQAQAEAIGHIEGRRAFFWMRVKGFCGKPEATAPVEPVPPITWLVSSMDLLQV